MACYRDKKEKQKKYLNDSDDLYIVFARFGSDYVFDECGGFCPVCWQMSICEDYKKVEDEWKWIYS